MQEEDYERLTDEILKQHLRHDDLWIFAYGSLMWRPACEIDGQEIAMLNGWHRKFCIRVARWRGTPEHPGLMMALDREGSCRAVVQRLSAKTAGDRLGQLLRRETTSKAHRPIAHAGLLSSQVTNGAGLSVLQLCDPVPIIAEIFHWRKPQRFSRRSRSLGFVCRVSYEHGPTTRESRYPRPKPVAAPGAGCGADYRSSGSCRYTDAMISTR